MPTSPADWECCICNELLLDPVCLNCGHAYCKGCLEQWQATCRKAGYASLPCPSCRRPIVEPFAVCQIMKKNIEAEHPEVVQQRRVEAQAKLSDVEKRLQQFMALQQFCANHVYRTRPLHHSTPLPISNTNSVIASPVFTHSNIGSSYNLHTTNHTVASTDNTNALPLLATPPPYGELRRHRTAHHVSSAGAGLPPLAPRRRTQTLHGYNSPVSQQISMTPVLDNRMSESTPSCRAIPFTPRTTSMSATNTPATSTPRYNGQGRTPILFSRESTNHVMTGSTTPSTAAATAMPGLMSPRHRPLSMPWEDASLVDPDIQANIHLLHQALSMNTVHTVNNSKEGAEAGIMNLVHATSSAASPTLSNIQPVARPDTPVALLGSRPRLSTSSSREDAAGPAHVTSAEVQRHPSNVACDISTTLAAGRVQQLPSRVPEATVGIPSCQIFNPTTEMLPDISVPRIASPLQALSLAQGCTPQHQRQERNGFLWPMITDPPCLIDSLGTDIDEHCVHGSGDDHVGSLATSHVCNRQCMDMQPTTCQQSNVPSTADQPVVDSSSSSRFTLALQRMAAQDAAAQAAGRPCLSALRQLFAMPADAEQPRSTFLHRSVCHTELASDDDGVMPTPAATPQPGDAHILAQGTCLPAGRPESACSGNFADNRLASTAVNVQQKPACTVLADALVSQCATSNTPAAVQPPSQSISTSTDICLTPQPASSNPASSEASSTNILRLASPLTTIRRSVSTSAVDTFSAVRFYPPTPRAAQPVPPSPFTSARPAAQPLSETGIASAPLFPLFMSTPELHETSQMSEPIIRSTASQSHYERQRVSHTLQMVATAEHATSRIIDDLSSTSLLQLLLARQATVDEPPVNKAQPWHNTLADRAMRAGCSSALVALFAEHYAQQLAQHGNHNHASMFQCVAVIEEFLYYNTPDRQQYADLSTLQDRMLQAVDQLITVGDDKQLPY